MRHVVTPSCISGAAGRCAPPLVTALDIRGDVLVAFLLKEEVLLTEGRLQFRPPGRLGIVLRKERAVDPIGVASLQEAQRKDLFSGNFAHPEDLDLAGHG